MRPVRPSASLAHGASAVRVAVRVAVCVSIGVALAGCSGPALLPGFGGFGGTKPLFANSQLSAQQAGELIVPGKTTQAEVLALLGSATVINFDSGQAVWVYRSTPARAASPGAEFVILFDRARVVQKTRRRPADASH